jgi:hypothetical protein
MVGIFSWKLVIMTKPVQAYFATKIKQSLCRLVTGPEDSRRLRLQDFYKLACEGGNVVALPAAFTSQETFLLLISVRG